MRGKDTRPQVPEKLLDWRGHIESHRPLGFKKASKQSAKSNDSQKGKQGATPVKGRRQTLATTPHHVTCALGLSADPKKHNPRLALLNLNFA